DGIRDRNVTGVQTCALPILRGRRDVTAGHGVDRERAAPAGRHAGGGKTRPEEPRCPQGVGLALDGVGAEAGEVVVAGKDREIERSEERRVGKEWRGERSREG